MIHWESYIPNAMVKIEGPGGDSVVLEGKLVNREERYRQNSIVYIRNSRRDADAERISILRHGTSACFWNGRPLAAFLKCSGRTQFAFR